MLKSRLIVLILSLFCLLALIGCQTQGQAVEPGPTTAETSLEADAAATEPAESTAQDQARTLDWQPISSLDLEYATEFTVDYYEGGYKLIKIPLDQSSFLVVPEGAEVPQGLDPDLQIIQQPVDKVYLSASAVMCNFDALGAIDRIRLSGTEADKWEVEAWTQAMEEGKILYAGKYKQPDYELIVDEGAKLSIQSTMINRSPEVKEKLQELGLVVLVDHSSYEDQPMGRAEWIKLYGALLNEEEKAAQIFQDQVSYLEGLEKVQTGEKTAVCFHISSSGEVYVRRSGDYVSKMLAMAGADNAFKEEGDLDTKKPIVAVEMESFFAGAKDADFIFYNATLGGVPEDLADFLSKNELLADFKAVETGNVWVISKAMYQESTKLGQIIQSLQQVVSGQADDLDDLPYLHRLR